VRVYVCLLCVSMYICIHMYVRVYMHAYMCACACVCAYHIGTMMLQYLPYEDVYVRVCVCVSVRVV